MNNIELQRYKTGIGLCMLTGGAVLIHGYHPFAEDAEIYLPGVEKNCTRPLSSPGSSRVTRENMSRLILKRVNMRCTANR